MRDMAIPEVGRVYLVREGAGQAPEENPRVSYSLAALARSYSSSNTTRVNKPSDVSMTESLVKLENPRD